MSDRYFVYILASQRNGTLYVGVTNDLVRRVGDHKAKAVPGFTSQYGVTQLVYFEDYGSILEARAREHAMKRWRRAWKIELIEKLNPTWRDLSSEVAFYSAALAVAIRRPLRGRLFALGAGSRFATTS